MNSGKSERAERRLAAILAADVAGYSRLMGEDEEGTLAALKRVRRELVDPTISESGRGDGGFGLEFGCLYGDRRTMPDGPRYDDDFYAWTQYQAEVLRTLRTRDNRFDRDNLVEEIEDLGRSYRDAVRSQVRRILLHFLKLEYSPAREPRSDWMNSIDDARAEIEDKLTPTLRRDLVEQLPRLYDRVRRQAARDLEKFDEIRAAQSLPAECPYAPEQVLAEDWYPAPAESARTEDRST